MTFKGKILGLTSGGVKGFSGTNKHLFESISKKYELVEVLNNKLSGFWKYYNLAYCFSKAPGYKKYIHPLEEIYSGNIATSRYRTIYYVMKRTEAADKMLKTYDNKYDLVLQTGWIPAINEKNKVPRCIYTDFTMKLSEREVPNWCNFLSEVDKNKWLEMETQSYQNADVVFTMSDNTRKSIIKDYKVNKDKVVTVYGGVNFDNHHYRDNMNKNNIILFVGVDFERKGGHVLLEAFDIVKNEVKDASLIILGSKPPVNVEGVYVKGFVPQSEKMRYYNIASVFVMPSIAEPFGLVFLEAMAYKLPCIGTTVDAIPEIIKDGENGYLVEPNDPIMLANRIIYILKNKELSKEMGNKGFEMVYSMFTWDKVVERMGSEFNKLI